jgi:sugar phosphate isomerase/epimerase
MQRRSFLLRSAALASAMGLNFSPAAIGIEPFDRPKPGKLRLSLAAYSLRKYLSPGKGESKKMDLFDFVDFCYQQGIAGISGGAIRNDFCQLDPQKVQADLAHTQKWVDHYSLLGAPVIRIFAGTQPKGEEFVTTLQRCAKNCELACSYAAQKGVILALENHGGVTEKAEGLLEIVRQVNAPAFGVNFDSGNFHSADPYSELKQIAPYSVNAQIKVDMTLDGKHEPTDLGRVLSILREAGYSGWVALEYESKDEPLEAIPRYLEQLRKLIDVS